MNFTADPANGRFISQDTYRRELDDANQWHLYAYCANNPINYTDPSAHWVIAIGGKAEAAIVFGAYVSNAFNFSSTRFAITGSAGGKIVTNATATVGVFAGYYKNKEISDLKGWSGYIGVSVGLSVGKINISAPFGVTINNKKISFSGLGGLISGGPTLAIPYYDLELGYTKILFNKKWSSVKSKESTYRVAGCRVIMKKYSSYYRVRIPVIDKQFKFYKSSKKVKSEVY